MKKICDYLFYIGASEEPLSSDVFFIPGQQRTYLFDVGCNREALDAIEAFPGKKVMILSHDHKDHTGNLSRILFQDLYTGDLTQRTCGKGRIVTDAVTIDDGVTIEIRHCPSPHTDGSLIVTVNSEYTLIADLYFHRPEYDREKARQMIHCLETVNTKYFVVSHQPGENIFERDSFISDLKEHFSE